MQVRRVSKSEMAHLTLMHRGLIVQRAASERYHDSRSGGSLFRDKGDTVEWYIDFRTLRASLTSDRIPTVRSLSLLIPNLMNAGEVGFRKRVSFACQKHWPYVRLHL